MHKLPQPVKLRYWGPVLPPRGAAGRAATASSPSSAPRRSAPTTRRSTPRSCSCSWSWSEAAGARDLRVRLSSLGTPETREAYLDGAGRPTCASTSPSSPRTCATGSTSNPLRAFDSDHPGTRAVMEGAPRLLDRLGRRRRRALRGGARAARRRRARRTRWTPRSCAGSTTTRARCSRSSPARSARRTRSAAAGATTGWWSSSAGRAPPGVGFAAGVERILLAAEPRRTSPAPAACTWRVAEPRRRALRLRARPAAARARPARGARAGRALAQGPAEAGRPDRRPSHGDRGRRASR